MSEQMKRQDKSPNSPHLDQVISCVKQVGKKDNSAQKSLEKLYGEAGKLIFDFETNINRCKRYNEAKINRKYEMIINDLEIEVRKLNQKLKIEQDARSPTKKHVADILDQLVAYKEENDRLKKELNQLKGQMQELNNRNQIQANAIKQLQATQPKAMVQRLPSLSSGVNVNESIKQYLKDKNQVRKIQVNADKSGFQRFLHSIVPKSWNWNIGNLLQEIDKWSEGIKTHKHVDMWKIRSSVAKSFSDCMDDSTTLTRPASFTKGILHPIRSEPNQLNRRESRFSVFGDRKDRSMIDPILH